MTALHTQSGNLFTSNTTAITFAVDETWTILGGVVVGSEQAFGIFSDFADDRLFNNGTIFSGSGFLAGAFFDGDNAFISNAAGARIIGALDGIFMKSNPATIENAGIVEGLLANGVDFFGSDGTLTNRGSIYGQFSGVNWQGDDGTIANAGMISSDTIGIFISTVDGVTTAITNAGGGSISGHRSGIEVGRGRIFLDNAGTVTGGVHISQNTTANDVVVNRGAIHGVSFLGTGNDRFAGAGGTSGAVFGQAGDDRLIGGNHPDRLHGGAGLDTLTGGDGGDQFFFDTGLDAALNVDRITDFTAGVDRIVLADRIFSQLGPNGALAAAHFHIGPAAADTSDRIIYNANTGFLFYDADGIGGVGQVHFATLSPHLALHGTDFLLVD